MFRKKRWLFLALFSALILLLAACGGSEEPQQNAGDEGTSDETTEETKGKITIFQSKVEISEQLEALAEEYTKETGVEVEVWGTTGDDYFQQLQISLVSDEGPTIFTLDGPIQAEQLQSYLYDMSDAEFVPNIAPNMELNLDGKIVGLPYGVEGFGLVYNKNLVDPSEVKDYDSFVATLERLYNEGINPVGLSQEAYFLIGHISNYPFSVQKDNVA